MSTVMSDWYTRYAQDFARLLLPRCRGTCEQYAFVMDSHGIMNETCCMLEALPSDIRNEPMKTPTNESVRLSWREEVSQLSIHVS